MSADMEKILEKMDEIDKEHRNVEKIFLSIGKLIFALPLIINAGASIALTDFFEKKDTPIQIVLATSSFIVGVALGLLTIGFVFFVAYKRWESSNKFWDDLRKKPANLNKIESRTITYAEEIVTRNKETENSIIFCIFNGALSLLACFVGLFFISVYITDNYCLLAIILILLVSYSFCAYLWLKKNLKLK